MPILLFGMMLCGAETRVFLEHQAKASDADTRSQGTTGVDNPNTNDAVNPMFNLTFNDWWMHAYDNVRRVVKF